MPSLPFRYLHPEHNTCRTLHVSLLEDGVHRALGWASPLATSDACSLRLRSSPLATSDACCPGCYPALQSVRMVRSCSSLARQQHVLHVHLAKPRAVWVLYKWTAVYVLTTSAGLDSARCATCSAGTYSSNAGATGCTACSETSSCSGGMVAG